MKNTLKYFARPHDFMSSWNYKNTDGITHLKNNGILINIVSGLLLIPSTPFALAPFLQENFSNIEIYKGLKKQNKNIRNQIINKER